MRHQELLPWAIGALVMCSLLLGLVLGIAVAKWPRKGKR